MSRRPLFPPVFAPTVSHPMVDDFSIRAARQRERQQPANVQSSYDIPLRNHPLWSGNNSLGFELDLEQDVNSTAIFSRTVLKLDEWGMPDVWTVALSTNYKPAAVDSQAFQLEGEIEFGSGGGVDTLNVDWVTGTVFRLPMNALSIKVFGVVGTGAGGADATVPPDLRARVILAKGELDGMPPQLTRQILSPFGNLAPWHATVPVPRYAKSFIPFGADTASADLLFAPTCYWVFYSNDPGIAATGQLIGAIRAQDALQYMGGDGIPIPSPARRVGFINGVAGNCNARLVFNLCI